MSEPLLRQILPDPSMINSARVALYWKALSITVVFLGGYVGMLFAASWQWRAVWAVVFIHGAVAMATGIMHDANHGSFSRSRRVNAILAWTADLLGASSHLWRRQHNVAHHHYTNVEGQDGDLEQDPFARLAPGQRWRSWHRFQQVYLWPLYGFLQVRWFLFGDLVSLKRVPLEERRALLWRVLAGKVLHASWALVLPMMLHGWFSVALWYLVCSWSVGLALAVIFQVAHAVDAAEFKTPGVKLTGDAMVRHQLETTVDVETKSVMRWYCWWLMGGLDHQIEHHLAPRVPHTAYAKMSLKVREVARDQGLRYRTHRSMSAAVFSHWRWLREMGRRPINA
jgi:linoleoyl-CoA desaturase